MEVAGIEISNPDKLIFPEQNISKGEVVKYYERIANKMLPHLKNRPLTLKRYPNGIKEKGFYQKSVSDYFPDFIERVEVETEEGKNLQIICNSKKALVYLAQQGTVVFHTWLSCKQAVKKPDKVVFDLDPSEDDFRKVKKAARLVKRFLEEKGLNPCLMTSGKKGLHVYYPKNSNETFDELKPTLKQWSEEMESHNPDIFTTAIRKSKREGKIFIDYLRNAYAQTSVCPYSLRATKNMGVATPISWDELNRIQSGHHYNYRNIFKRLGQIS